MKVSATLVTLNEERSLPRALHSLAWCDEIVVVDSGSTDATESIARSFGAKFLRRDWPGYVAQKNFAAESAAHDWILAIDADEEVGDRLQAAIEAVRRDGPRFDAYRFARRARYLGGWIGHSGWYPDAKIRLYDRRRARWAGGSVHESVVCDGSVGRLDGELLHYTCDDFSAHIRTVDRYTGLAAADLAAQGTRPGWWRLALSPPWAVFRSFIVQRGFLDGWRGWLIAVMAGFYVFAKYAKARAALER